MRVQPKSLKPGRKLHQDPRGSEISLGSNLWTQKRSTNFSKAHLNKEKRATGASLYPHWRKTLTYSQRDAFCSKKKRKRVSAWGKRGKGRNDNKEKRIAQGGYISNIKWYKDLLHQQKSISRTKLRIIVKKVWENSSRKKGNFTLWGSYLYNHLLRTNTWWRRFEGRS